MPVTKLEDFMAFKSVFNPDFKYRSANATDVRRTFERIRREQRKAQPAALEAANKNIRMRPPARKTPPNESQKT
jgi:hypothetical protein